MREWAGESGPMYRAPFRWQDGRMGYELAQVNIARLRAPIDSQWGDRRNMSW